MADRRISKRLKGNAHLCHTGMSVRNGNLGTDRTTTTQAASVRKQLGPKKIARITRADMRRMVELREETGVQRSLTERLVRREFSEQDT